MALHGWNHDDAMVNDDLIRKHGLTEASLLDEEKEASNYGF